MDFFLKQINPENDDPIKISLHSDEITIGRRNIVSLNSYYKVSRSHAKFSKRNGVWFVRDLGSLNKLYVNFKEVNEQWVKVEIGDIIGFGTPSCNEEGSFVCVLTVKSRIKQESFDSFDEYSMSSTEKREVTCPVSQAYNKKGNDTNIKIKTEPPSSDYDTYQLGAAAISKNIKTEQNALTSNKVNSNNAIHNYTDVSKEVCFNKLTSPGLVQSSSDKSSYPDTLRNFIKTEPNTQSCKFINSDKVLESSDSSISLPHTNVSPETLHNVKTISPNSNNSEESNLTNEDVLETGRVNLPYSETLENWNKEFRNQNSLLNGNGNGNNDSNQKSMISSTCNSKPLETKSVADHKTEENYFVYPKIKECSVRLVKCDSIYFQSPKDMKNGYLSENMNVGTVQATVEKKYDTLSASFAPQTKRERLQKSVDKPKESACKRRKCNSELLLNIHKNRILSSDSETSSEECYRENESDERDSFNPAASESCEIKIGVEKRDKTRLKSDWYHSKYKSSLVKSNPESKLPTKRTDSAPKQMKKRPKFIESESDSSVSNSQCTILYPSAKAFKYKRAFRRYSHSSSDENCASLSDGKEDCVSHSDGNLETECSSRTKFESEKNDLREPFVVNVKRITAGRTLLTDPKPMKYRPKRMRGREEYFRERGLFNPVGNEGDNKVGQKVITKNLKMRTIPKINKRASCTSKSFINQSFNSKNKSSYGHFPSKNKESREQDIVNTLTKTRGIEYFSRKTSTLAVSKETRGNDCSLLKRSTPAVPKRPNNYGSRMGFLVDVESKKIAPEKKTSPGNLKNKNPTLVHVTNSAETISNAELSRNDEIKSTETNLEGLKDDAISLNQHSQRTFEAAPNVNTTNALEKAREKCEKGKEKKINQCPVLSRSYSLPSGSISESKSFTVGSSLNSLLPEKIFPDTSKFNVNKKVAIISPVKHNTAAESNSICSYSSNPIDASPVQESTTEKSADLFQSSSDTDSNRKKPINRSDSAKDKNLKEACSDSELKLHSRSLIENILHWNPKWLEEQSKNKKPPPLVSKGGATIPLRFSSYNSYVKSFCPMLTLEIWESLFRESKPLWLENESWNAFYYIIRSTQSRRGVMELDCESIVNENLSYHPTEGTVVLLDVKNAEQGINSCAFGYIHCHKLGNVCDSEKLTEWIKVPAEWQKNAKVWTISIFIKKSKRHGISTGSVHLARGIINIKNRLQLVEALLAFKESPLQKDILNPSSELFSFYESNSKIPREQLIQSIGDEINKENCKSKTILINAPPGTGKTGAIIGLVEKLLFGSPCQMKIVLCAPTNMGVDEIGLRLVELNERNSWKGKYIKFVRFGQTDQINYKLHVYALDKKVSKMFKEQNKKELLDRERELEILESKINDVLFREQQKNNKYRLRRINNDTLKDLMNQLKTLKEKSPLEYIDPATQATYESIILKESQVLLLTLDDCMHPLINKFFKFYTKKLRACCIVDEATQSTEPEILQCLNRKVDRLVLVGDIKQLPPPVTSTYAIKWGFKRSLMERLLTLFSKQNNCILSPTMIEQYRMQTQICDFPSKYFYNDQLVTNSIINERCLYSPLKPFIVYDILHKETLNPSVNPDDSEPLIIAYICSQLLQVEPKASIGVIATSEYRAALYKVPLSTNEAFRDIEINVVEKYHGREKDIIILACIHPFHPIDDKNFLACEKKMNVAITRAQKCLIVCGHISSLSEYPHWLSFMTEAHSRKVAINVSSLQQIPIIFMKTICKNA
ncbi:probable helicase senataxin [Trichonephila clavata]|uniref:Probable helicase senataxin n=1 Tax=Trichonephila clavata TaxID=2740835 RepID=A0A8X6GLY1_TRICU|nr:probable helicase senataxin [Trichonephila clavata]